MFPLAPSFTFAFLGCFVTFFFLFFFPYLTVLFFFFFFFKLHLFKAMVFMEVMYECDS